MLFFIKFKSHLKSFRLKCQAILSDDKKSFCSKEHFVNNQQNKWWNYSFTNTPDRELYLSQNYIFYVEYWENTRKQILFIRIGRVWERKMEKLFVSEV